MAAAGSGAAAAAVPSQRVTAVKLVGDPPFARPVEDVRVAAVKGGDLSNHCCSPDKTARTSAYPAGPAVKFCAPRPSPMQKLRVSGDA